MKTKRLLKGLFILPAILLALTSCKTDDPEFAAGPIGGYAIQNGDLFEPYVGMYAVYGQLKSAKIVKNGVPLIGTGYYDENIYLLDPAANSNTLLGLTGIYYFGIESEKGETSTGKHGMELNFANNKAMGEVAVSDFRYENGQIKATFEPVENATHYGFYIEGYIGGVKASAYQHHYPTNRTEASTSAKEVAIVFTSTLYNYSKLSVTPIAINHPTSSSAIFRKAGESRDLERGASEFDAI